MSPLGREQLMAEEGDVHREFRRQALERLGYRRDSLDRRVLPGGGARALAAQPRRIGQAADRVTAKSCRRRDRISTGVGSRVVMRTVRGLTAVTEATVRTAEAKEPGLFGTCGRRAKEKAMSSGSRACRRGSAGLRAGGTSR
jgi:hypothetical protein